MDQSLIMKLLSSSCSLCGDAASEIERLEHVVRHATDDVLFLLEELRDLDVVFDTMSQIVVSVAAGEAVTEDHRAQLRDLVDRRRAARMWRPR